LLTQQVLSDRHSAPASPVRRKRRHCLPISADRTSYPTMRRRRLQLAVNRSPSSKLASPTFGRSPAGLETDESARAHRSNPSPFDSIFAELRRSRRQRDRSAPPGVA
jgi:hypothetical protein